MNNQRSSLFLAALLSSGAGGCDRTIGVVDVVHETSGEDGPVLAGKGCSSLSRDDRDVIGGALGGGDDFAFSSENRDGTVYYRYYIAPEDSVGEEVWPETGELAAEIVADYAFFADGGTKTASFQTHDGRAFEVTLWGVEDCDGEIPDTPPHAP
ncbi:MAG: hypothetical protein B7733_01315 [Myxococcales bacterium FL481]|nr:MAG: hypothetical protein B7733_01315 [Myxococcales bacterium FL481]